MNDEMRERRFSFHHCCSAPVTNSSNIVVQIHGQNLNIDDMAWHGIDDMASLYYPLGTRAIYKCKTPRPNATYSEQEWRCTRNGRKYLWEKKPPNQTDLVCDGKGSFMLNTNGGSDPINLSINKCP